MGVLFPAVTKVASPVRLYQVGVEGGGQQEDGQLKHAAQPEEDGAGDHGNHAAKYQELSTWAGGHSYTLASSAYNRQAEELGLTSGWVQMFMVGHAGVESLLLM